MATDSHLSANSAVDVDEGPLFPQAIADQHALDACFIVAWRYWNLLVIGLPVSFADGFLAGDVFIMAGGDDDAFDAGFEVAGDEDALDADVVMMLHLAILIAGADPDLRLILLNDRLAPYVIDDGAIDRLDPDARAGEGVVCGLDPYARRAVFVDRRMPVAMFQRDAVPIEMNVNAVVSLRGGNRSAAGEDRAEKNAAGGVAQHADDGVNKRVHGRSSIPINENSLLIDFIVPLGLLLRQVLFVSRCI